jgi:hypothetical protein
LLPKVKVWAKVRCSCGRTSQNNRDGLALIKSGLVEGDLIAKSKMGKKKE